MRDIEIQHVAGLDSGLRIRDGHLIWREFIPAFQLGDSPDEQAPECCHEDPGATLYDVSADLVAFFDKWFGAGYKTDVDGYYQWVGATCEDLFIKVPTDATIDTAIASLCTDNLLLILVVNTLRDTIWRLTNIGGGDGSMGFIRRRPFPALAGIEQCPQRTYQDLPPRFDALYSPGKPCDDSMPCLPGGNRNHTNRFAVGEKICRYHCDELVALVDDILTNGVIFFEVEMRPGSTSPCADLTLDRVCVREHRIDYNSGGCPGSQDSESTTDSVEQNQGQYVRLRLNADGSGFEEETQVYFEVKVPAGLCPPAGLTNTKSLDPRITTLNNSWNDYTFTYIVNRPDINDLGCPGDFFKSCGFAGTYGYGELA